MIPTELLTRVQAGLAGSYRVERELGSGGMAIVFLAWDLKHDRPVALKLLRPELAAGVGIERFLREIQIAARLVHPNILPLLDSGTVELGGGLSAPYYCMPRLEGETLRERLARTGPLGEDEAVALVRDVADALDYAHGRGLVHRDIKPENIFLERGHAIVSDFGIAKAISAGGAGQTLTEQGFAIGTPAYMSPEQILGAEVDGRSDQYSLACVLFELVTGSSPFSAPSPQQVIAGHTSRQPPDLSRLRPGVAPSVTHAVQRALAKEPATRFPTASAFVEALVAPVPARQRLAVRRSLVVLAAALLVVLGVTGAWFARRRASAAPAATTLAVLPFKVSGNDSLGLGSGMVNLLSTKLDGAAALHTVDPRAILSHVGAGAAGLDAEGARAVAARFGAGYFVLGEIVAVAGNVRLDAALYDGRRAEAVARASAEGPAARVFEMVDELATRLLTAWGGGSVRLPAIAAITTHSLPALKAYLEGEAAFREGRHQAAADAFRAAVTADSLFALAWYRLSVAGEWLTRVDLAREGAERAAALSERLSEHDRLLLEALRRSRNGRPEEGEALYRSILATYPNDVEAWIQLGEVLFHFGPTAGRPVTESAPAWRRVLFFEPDNVSALLHLVRVVSVQGDTRELDSLVTVLTRLQPEGDRRLEALALRAMRSGDSAAQAAVLAQLQGASDVTLSLAAYVVACWGENLPGAVRVAQTLGAPARSRPAQTAGHLMAAWLETARGRPGAARAELAAAAAADPRAALESGTLLRLLAPGELTAAELAAAERAVAALDTAQGPSLAPSGLFIAAHDGAHGVLQDYLLGLLAARHDPAAAARYAAAVARAGIGGPAQGFMPLLAAGIRAEADWHAGRRPAALETLEREWTLGWYEPMAASPFFAVVHERLLRSEALAAAGRNEEAAKWFGSFEQFSPFSLALAPYALVRRGELLLAAGQAPAAAAAFERALWYWSDAEPVMAPLVERARAGLARARGGT